MSIPIKGNNIILRNLGKSDAEAIFHLAQDRTISRYTFTPYPFKMANAHKLIRTFQKLYRQKAAYGFGIEDKESGQLAGMIVLVAINSRHKRAEIAYWLGKDYRGRGLMSESLQFILRFAFREQKLNRIAAVVFPENKNSCKLLKKAGFVNEGLMRKYLIHRRRRRDCFLYSILKEEWAVSKKCL